MIRCAIKKLSQNLFLVIPTERSERRNLAGTALLDLEGEIPRLRFAPLGMTTLF